MNKFVLLLLSLSLLFIASCADSDDDGPEPVLPTLSVSSVTLFEGDANTTFNFRVTASVASEQAITFEYKTEEETATMDEDYTHASGTMTIPAGERSVTLEIEILADSIKEADEEFKVVISNPTNATIANAEGVGTIRNDDTFIFVPQDGYITPESYTGYDLVWRDEFNGNSLNMADWRFEMGAGGWGNQELQYYTDRSENLQVSNGYLIIEAREEAFNGAPYTSARIITLGKQSFTHGRVDIRAILPEGQGIWPALWMLGESITTIGWPACGEIDIMELVGHEPETVHGTAHWGPQGQTFSINKGEPYSLTGGQKFSDEYHVFSIIWEPNSIKWYVDDNHYFTLTNADVNGAYPFDADFFFIFNIAVGGKWPGSPDATTQFPQTMTVDYVRIFQKK